MTKARAKSTSRGVEPDPPRPLGDRGLDLWFAILQNYTPTDALDLELLYQGCAAAERADELRQMIEREGLVVTAESGAVKDHPRLKHELAFRAFATRTLGRIIATAGDTDERTGFVKRREKFWGRRAGE